MKNLIISFITSLIFFSPYLMATDVVFNVVVPVPTYECWIVGSFNNWNYANTQKCTKTNNTHYTITLNDSTWINGITSENLEYNYLSGPGDWAYMERNADGSTSAVRKYNVQVTDTVDRWLMIYTPVIPDPPVYITIDVLTPVGTTACYIIGNFNNWESPVDSCKMSKVFTDKDGNIIFEKRLFTLDMNKLSFRFCSGPSLEYAQSLPTGNFQYPNVTPTVTAWKATYTASPQLPASKVKIYSNASDIIIDGTEMNDMVTVYSVTGLKVRTFKSVGEPIVFAAREHEIYFVKTPDKSAKILVK
jgi:hypothetical protein